MSAADGKVSFFHQHCQSLIEYQVLKAFSVTDKLTSIKILVQTSPSVAGNNFFFKSKFMCLVLRGSIKLA